MNENDGQGANKARVISAGDTFVAKVVISSAFLFMAVVLVALALRPLTSAHGLGISPLRIVERLALLGMAMWVVWSLVPLKRVALSETSLHVSNYLREIVVPLSDVNSVTEIEGRAYRVVIEFKRRTRFGRRIRFSPIGWTPPSPHPIVAELRAAIAAATHAHR